MAESVTEMPVVNETVNATADNATAKIPATPEGMFVAYSSLVIMALIPIFLGSFRSVRYHKEQKVNTLACFIAKKQRHNYINKNTSLSEHIFK